MRAIMALALALAATLSGTASAQDCRFENAIYTEPTGTWTLRFEPRTPGASNKTSSFLLDLQAGVTLEGAIYWPNGYATPIYTLDGPCEPGSLEEPCNFLEGENPTAYMLTETGIERLPQNMTGPAPKQVLLPRLGLSLWYSRYRETEFAPDVDPGDVFTYSGCAK